MSASLLIPSPKQIQVVVQVSKPNDAGCSHSRGSVDLKGKAGHTRTIPPTALPQPLQYLPATDYKRGARSASMQRITISLRCVTFLDAAEGFVPECLRNEYD